MKDIIIAIDGYAGCGKSSTAQRVAQKLRYLYIDTGAMYRAVSLYFLQNSIPFEAESPSMQDALDNIYIDFVDSRAYARPMTHLNGQLVEEAIRHPEVSAIVSQVSTHGMVRKELVRQQQRMGEDKRVVMDGRDIGTVVFPEAELKVFMTASLEVRARRRQEELDNKGVKQSLEAISQNLADRDRIDTQRAIAPLKQAPDAVVIDTTEMTLDQQVARILALARERMRA